MIFNKLYYQTPNIPIIEYTIDGGVTWEPSSLLPRKIDGYTYKSDLPNGYYIPSIDLKYNSFEVGNNELISAKDFKFRFPEEYNLDLNNIYIVDDEELKRYNVESFESDWFNETTSINGIVYNIYTYVKPDSVGSNYLLPRDFHLEFHFV